jgi:hypothetical protein
MQWAIAQVARVSEMAPPHKASTLQALINEARKQQAMVQAAMQACLTRCVSASCRRSHVLQMIVRWVMVMG